MTLPCNKLECVSLTNYILFKHLLIWLESTYKYLTRLISVYPSQNQPSLSKQHVLHSMITSAKNIRLAESACDVQTLQLTETHVTVLYPCGTPNSAPLCGQAARNTLKCQTRLNLYSGDKHATLFFIQEVLFSASDKFYKSSGARNCKIVNLRFEILKTQLV